MKVAYYFEKMLERSPKSIEPPHNKYVAFADLSEGVLQTPALADGSACDIGEDFFAARGCERVPLQIQILIRRRNPSVTKKHDPPPAVKKLIGPDQIVTLISLLSYLTTS
jgi:hypothetical protein